MLHLISELSGQILDSQLNILTVQFLYNCIVCIANYKAIDKTDRIGAISVVVFTSPFV